MAPTQDALYRELDIDPDLSWSERDLPERERTKHVHRLHPYLGKYIPQLVEELFRRHVPARGRVLDHNRWLGGAELDLVVRRGRVLAFVEVKSKSGDGFGDPFEMVTPVKIARIRRATELWLLLHPELAELDVRFDVIAERAGKIEHLPDAF